MSSNRYQKSAGSQQLLIDWSASESRHVVIEVGSDHRHVVPANTPTVQRTKRIRYSSCLPIPTPLSASVAAAICPYTMNGGQAGLFFNLVKNVRLSAVYGSGLRHLFDAMPCFIKL
jgi:hypothetical protein